MNKKNNNKKLTKKSKMIFSISIGILLLLIVIMKITSFFIQKICYNPRDFSKYQPSFFCDNPAGNAIRDLYYSNIPFIILIIFTIVVIVLLIILCKKVEKSSSRKKLIILIIVTIIISMFPMKTLRKAIYPNELDEAFSNVSIDKPIIYIYPTEEINLSIKLGNAGLLTHTYPKYNDGWNVKVDASSNITDIDTNKDYYALYWEGKDNTPEQFNDGFVVKGKDTITFLEDKLSVLGLSDREINEFIIYWLPKMENNKYNLIRFRTMNEINEYMPMNLSKTPDTLIRVYMDFKKLNKNVTVKEQVLKKQERTGFTIVEWGGREIK